MTELEKHTGAGMELGKCQCQGQYGGTPCRSYATRVDGLCDFCRNAHG